MVSLNKCMFIGNVGRIEVKTFQDNGKVVNASLAVGEKYTRRDGTVVDNTLWLNLVVNGTQAENMEKYVQKGTRLYVEGRLKQRSYQTREGEKREIWEVMVSNWQNLSPKEAAAAEDDLPPSEGEAPANDDFEF